jgi:Zn-dependent peptidase ImmA (M78 family)
MYRPQIRRKKSGAPVLSRKEIDDIGENLVKDFNPSALITPQEIDIDLLAQDYLGMEQDFQYLSHCGVYLGMTVFNDTGKVPVYDPNLNRANYISAKAHTVIIDNTLLAENQQHRYRFTMGHEVSHDFLHTEYFAYDPNQLALFGKSFDFPMVQCRVDSKKLEVKQQKSWTDRDWMEWQANALSSAILMPKSVVLKVAGDVAKGCTEKHLIPYAEIRKVSEIFNVSFEAAMYRLKELNVISTNFVMNKGVLDFWELIILK